ncbi:hypothetical protein LL912_07915 [Niabella sp. CC-SYL272]|uniref:DUF6624 domain-containing protein n=1 Tax=Niabella agricola TaxID=2891571 RepID=UPI001F189D33|nr:DUF6624 domain-containing protein [Niabella agricola]MCF3108701.1 hypothetical protein [Niabella agricola]
MKLFHNFPIKFHMKRDASIFYLFPALSLLWLAVGCTHGRPGAMLSKTKAAPSLMDQLAAIDYEDQRYRQEIEPVINAEPMDSAKLKTLFKKIHRADSINLLAIRHILDHEGWPDPKQVGIEGSVTVWAVLQHADLKTREQYLDMVTQAVTDKKLEPKYRGYLEDRIAGDKGMKQRYGTQQFLISKHKTVLAPLLDPDKVDSWRKEVGMEPLLDHLKRSIDSSWTWDQYYRDLPEGEAILKKKKEYFDAHKALQP